MEPKFIVCRGKNCRKKKKDQEALLDALSDIASIKMVSCRNICKGPIVGYVGRGEPVWFKRVDSAKSRRGLVKLATRGKLTKPLRKRLVKK